MRSARVFTRNPHAWCMVAMLVLAGSSGGRPVNAATTSAQPPSLGAHTLQWQGQGKGVSPLITAPLATQATGSSVLVIEGGAVGNAEPPTDSSGTVWKPVAHNIFRGYHERFDANAWVATDVHGGANYRIHVVKPLDPASEMTVGVVEIRNAGELQSIASDYPAPARFDAWLARLVNPLPNRLQLYLGGRAKLTSAAVTTTGPATLIAVWWGDATVYRMTAVPDNGFKVIDSFLHLPPNSGVQCAVASREVSAAGTYRVTWTDRPAQGAILWLFAFQSRQNPAG